MLFRPLFGDKLSLKRRLFLIKHLSVLYNV
jgi:hypothetical protein